MKNIERLRPHHILCMHGFIGEGYDYIFTENMSGIIDNILESNSVEIVFYWDNICSKCPNLNDKGFCKTEKKVRNLDKKTIELLELKEMIYNYNELRAILKNRLTPDKLVYICSECSWYQDGICKKTVFTNLNSDTPFDYK
ncbi:DUF1284 domain-containing protein [bacterium]|nr:DUF1284 domain-containing protein [bacterium]